jgi:hypothetical protein
VSVACAGSFAGTGPLATGAAAARSAGIGVSGVTGRGISAIASTDDGGWAAAEPGRG